MCSRRKTYLGRGPAHPAGLPRSRKARSGHLHFVNPQVSASNAAASPDLG